MMKDKARTAKDGYVRLIVIILPAQADQQERLFGLFVFQNLNRLRIQLQPTNYKLPSLVTKIENVSIPSPKHSTN